jgi:hypothetical protein
LISDCHPESINQSMTATFKPGQMLTTAASPAIAPGKAEADDKAESVSAAALTMSKSDRSSSLSGRTARRKRSPANAAMACAMKMAANATKGLSNPDGLRSN